MDLSTRRVELGGIAACANKHNAMSGWIDAYPKEFQRTGSLNLGHDPILHARAILLPRQTMRGLE